MLLPECLFNLATAPLVVAYLIFYEGTGIALVIDITLTDQSLHDARLRIFWQFPTAHLLQHLILAVLSLCTECSERQVGIVL